MVLLPDCGCCGCDCDGCVRLFWDGASTKNADAAWPSSSQNVQNGAYNPGGGLLVTAPSDWWYQTASGCHHSWTKTTDFGSGQVRHDLVLVHPPSLPGVARLFYRAYTSSSAIKAINWEKEVSQCYGVSACSLLEFGAGEVVQSGSYGSAAAVPDSPSVLFGVCFSTADIWKCCCGTYQDGAVYAGLPLGFTTDYTEKCGGVRNCLPGSGGSQFLNHSVNWSGPSIEGSAINDPATFTQPVLAATEENINEDYNDFCIFSSSDNVAATAKQKRLEIRALGVDWMFGRCGGSRSYRIRCMNTVEIDNPDAFGKITREAYEEYVVAFSWCTPSQNYGVSAVTKQVSSCSLVQVGFNQFVRTYRLAPSCRSAPTLTFAP